MDSGKQKEITSPLVEKEVYCCFGETEWREGEIGKEFTQIKNHQEESEIWGLQKTYNYTLFDPDKTHRTNEQRNILQNSVTGS